MDIGKLITESWTKFSANLAMGIVIFLVGSIVGSLLSALTLGIVGIPVFAGMYKVYRKMQHGEAPDFSDLFSEFSNIGFWIKLWLLALIVGVAIAIVSLITVGIGSILALPVGIALFFVVPLMLEKKMDAFEAAKESMSKMKENIGSLAVPALIVMIIAAAGGIVIGLGALVTAPWMMIAGWMIYDEAYG